MISIAGTLAAPFPYFGGKANACEQVWQAFGAVDNYVEAFAGSAAMLLGAPDGKRIATINDADGFVANFWRAIAQDPEAVAHHADWPCNEVDLFARHSWLVRQTSTLTQSLHADPEWFDAKIAGWWCWGACNWIGSGWCSGTGPWIHDGERLVNSRERSEAGTRGAASTGSFPTSGTRGKRHQPAASTPRGRAKESPAKFPSSQAAMASSVEACSGRRSFRAAPPHSKTRRRAHRRVLAVRQPLQWPPRASSP